MSCRLPLYTGAQAVNLKHYQKHWCKIYLFGSTNIFMIKWLNLKRKYLTTLVASGLKNMDCAVEHTEKNSRARITWKV